MTTFADPELLLGNWIFGLLGEQRKVWVDPRLPDDWNFTAPIVQVQRGAGAAGTPLSLDDVTLDVSVFAKKADLARDVANEIWSGVTYQLPKTTLPGGVFVTYARAYTAPTWGPEKWCVTVITMSSAATPVALVMAVRMSVVAGGPIDVRSSTTSTRLFVFVLARSTRA